MAAILMCLRRLAQQGDKGDYKKVSYEEAQESFGRHHPAFVEGDEIYRP